MNELFNAFYNDVYFFALKTCADEDIACEVTQETFIEVINTIGALQESAALLPPPTAPPTKAAKPSPTVPGVMS